jgi:transposase
MHISSIAPVVACGIIIVTVSWSKAIDVTTKKTGRKSRVVKNVRYAQPSLGESNGLFKSHDFFDARDLIQVKYEMLRRVREDAWSISRAAAAYGFSRPSFYQAQSEFEHAGLAGFMPERRGPREAHKLNGIVRAFIEDLKSKDKTIRTTELVRRIKERFGIDIHRRTIERAVSSPKKNFRTVDRAESKQQALLLQVRRTSLVCHHGRSSIDWIYRDALPRSSCMDVCS